MVLNPAQGIRFFQLLDSVVDFANARLGLNLRVGCDRAQRDPEKQSEVMRALCAHPEVLREYVALNPSGFSASLLKDAASWCEALDGRFPYCVRPNGDVELLFEDHIIELTGLSLEVDSMLKSDIGFVEVCLLPFAGRIVFASAMAEYDMAIGAGLAKQFDAWFADARENGRIIRTTDEYLTAIALLKAQRDKREAQQLIEDTEYDLNPPTEFPGVHRSPLADMPFEERDACIEEEAWRILENFEGGALTIEKTLRKHCVKGERRTDLVSLAATEKNADLEKFLSDIGASRSSGLNKKKLVVGITEQLAKAPEGISRVFTSMEPVAFARMKRLFDAGGVLVARIADIDSLKEFPLPVPLLCYLFDEGDNVACVIPDEVFAAMKTLDWVELARYFDEVRRARQVADLLVATRGMLTFDEAFAEYNRIYPDGFSRNALTGALSLYIKQFEPGFEVLFDDEHEEWYFVDARLLDELDESGEPVVGFDGLNIGKLGFLEDLLAARAGKDPWKLPFDMVEAGDYLDWASALPSARAFEQFLNENVPDGENDYTFADALMEEILTNASAGVDVTALVQYLADRGLGFEDIRHMNKMLGLLFALINDLPRWDNNGWPPTALHAAASNKPVFRNPDGSYMKVGRNDPCPCGSGKKYKKCCGR